MHRSRNSSGTSAHDPLPDCSLPLAAMFAGLPLGVIRHLLHRPSVAVGIVKEHERPPREDIDLAHLHSPSGQLRSRLVNVAHDDLEVVQRSGRELRQPLADCNRARGAWRGQLDEANVITHRVVVVENETSLVDVEGFGAVHIADRNTDEFEFEIHKCTVLGGSDSFF